MNKNFQDTRSDDPDSLTPEDREVLKRKILTSTNIINALKNRKVGEPRVASRHFPETGTNLIYGILLIVTGVIVAFATSVSAIGIIIGAMMVIGGIIFSFTNIGGARRRDTA